VPPHAPLAPAQEAVDPFWVPPGLVAFAKDCSPAGANDRRKAEALMDVLVSPEEQGGLGIQYANDRTRTVNEAWLERKANCLTLTMMYTMLAKQLQISAGFAESLDASNWSRAGDVILKEKHMVAIVLWNPPNVLIADFLAPRKTSAKYGGYFLNRMTDARAKSLFYSNRAVECLIVGDTEGAVANVQLALDADPASPQAWNTKGVIEKSQRNSQEAEKSYKNAIRSSPNDVTAIGNLASLYRSEGYLEEAIRLRAVEDRLRKMDPYYLAFLASEAVGKSDYKKAHRLIQRAIKIHPSDSDFYLTLSDIFRAQSKKAEALGALRKARSHAIQGRIEHLDAMIGAFEADLAD
jgi:tetratricopeptide (TPR) repeat protein